MPATLKKYLLFWGLILGAVIFFLKSYISPLYTIVPTAVVTLTPVATPTLAVENIFVQDSPLKDSIMFAGDYLSRQQLANGELSYQVNFLTNERSYTPSHARLMSGTAALFTVCRVSGDLKYCNAGDLALNYYLKLLVNNPAQFKGTCYYTEGNCQLSGAALTVDAIYKRWQAARGFFLKDINLLDTAVDIGYFIVSMRKPEGGFYQSYDPYFGGTVDPNFFAVYSASESLLALTELYEMTGNEFWLKQAREINNFMITQPVTEDHFHALAFSRLAKLDNLSQADLEYAKQIADVVIAGEVRSLHPTNTSIASATKLQALASLAQAFYLSGAKYEWLDPEMHAFITFVRARQLPDNNCGWELNDDMILKYGGGVFNSCDDPSIRVDGPQNWIDSLAAYLEYENMISAK